MISESFDAFVCDLDGVIYRGSEPIPGAAEAVARLRAGGKRFLFCTNNSQATVTEYVGKLDSFGIKTAPEEVLTSATVTAGVLEARGLAGTTVYLVGGLGIREELEGRGFRIVENLSAGVGVVVVGSDLGFDFEMMKSAARAVRGGAVFVATNADPSFPAPDGLWPGAGAILASIEVASGRTAEILGKPHAPMMDAAEIRLAGCERIAAIGDQPVTDLFGARAKGWATILVTSGVTTAEAAATLDPPPDHVLPSIADLL